jgi:hypothetical protein
MVHADFRRPDTTPNQAKRRKNGFSGNQPTSYAPGSLQKLPSHLETYRFTRD